MLIHLPSIPTHQRSEICSVTPSLTSVKPILCGIFHWTPRRPVCRDHGDRVRGAMEEEVLLLLLDLDPECGGGRGEGGFGRNRHRSVPGLSRESQGLH